MKKRVQTKETLPQFDTREFRNCLGHFATGITVVTCQSGRVKHGITVNSFTSVSLDPPLVLVSIDRRAKSCQLLKDNNFVVNVLKKNQWSLAMHFAGRPNDSLSIKWEEGRTGPRLADCLAYIECRPWRSYDGGDHVLYLGEVIHFASNEGDPVLYYRGKFRHLSQ